MVERADGGGTDRLVLTDAGRRSIEALGAARRDSLLALLEGWDPEEHPEVVAMVRRLARELLADDDRLLADARPVQVPAT